MTQALPRWEETLRADLNSMSADEQIITSGEWITHITRNLLTELGRHRRMVIWQELEDPDVDAGILADRLGSRRTTIERLAAEARLLRRGDVT